MTAKTKTGVLAFLLLVNGIVINDAFADKFPRKFEFFVGSEHHTPIFAIEKPETLIKIKLFAQLNNGSFEGDEYCVKLLQRVHRNRDESVGKPKCAPLDNKKRSELYHEWGNLDEGIYKIVISKKSPANLKMKGDATAVME